MSETSHTIAVRGLHKGFENNQVLRGVDIDVDKGRSLVIIGIEGAAAIKGDPWPYEIELIGLVHQCAG